MTLVLQFIIRIGKPFHSTGALHAKYDADIWI